MFLVVQRAGEDVSATSRSRSTTAPTPSALGEQYDLMMPFEAVRILDAGLPAARPAREGRRSPARQQGAFWPRVGGQPFQFHLSATDTDGNAADLAMPLIFVGKDETDADYDDSIVPNTSPLQDEKVRAAVRIRHLARVPAAATPRVPPRLPEDASGESAAGDDTAFAVQSLTFGGEVPAKAKYRRLGAEVVRFFPVVRNALLDVPSLQRMAETKKAADVVYPDDYLVAGFDAAANAGPGVPRSQPQHGRQARRRVQRPGRSLRRYRHSRPRAQRGLTPERADHGGHRDRHAGDVRPQGLVRRPDRSEASSASSGSATSSMGPGSMSWTSCRSSPGRP